MGCGGYLCVSMLPTSPLWWPGASLCWGQAGREEAQLLETSRSLPSPEPCCYALLGSEIRKGTSCSSLNAINIWNWKLWSKGNCSDWGNVIYKRHWRLQPGGADQHMAPNGNAWHDHAGPRLVQASLWLLSKPSSTTLLLCKLLLFLTIDVMSVGGHLCQMQFRLCKTIALKD